MAIAIETLLRSLVETLNNGGGSEVRDSPLNGKSFLIQIVDGTEQFVLLLKETGVQLEADGSRLASATDYWVKVRSAVLEDILCGKLDPLVAILTRRVVTNIDPLVGPHFRNLLLAGQKRADSDMGWQTALRIKF